MKIYPIEVIKAKIASRRKLKKVSDVVGLVFALLVIFFAAVVGYQKFIKKSDTVSVFGITSYVVLTGSMQPTIDAGDWIVVFKAREQDIREGDVVTFADASGARVTHRIAHVYTAEDGTRRYATKGDYNNAADVGTIAYRDIEGKYCFRIRQGGALAKVFLTPTGVLLAVLIIVLMYFNSCRIHGRNAARRSIRERYKKQNATAE